MRSPPVPSSARQDWRHLRLRQRFCVYPVQAEVPEAIDRILALAPPGPLDVLEIGTGCGIIACALAASGHRVVATDLLPDAARLARDNAQANGLSLQVAVCDLARAIAPHQRFDLIVFNVPNTLASTRFGNLLQHLGPVLLPRRLLEPVSRVLARHGKGQSTAKRHLLERLLPELAPQLAAGGKIFLLMQDADIEALARIGGMSTGMYCETIGLRSSGCTRLLCISPLP